MKKKGYIVLICVVIVTQICLMSNLHVATAMLKLHDNIPADAADWVAATTATDSDGLPLSTSSQNQHKKTANKSISSGSTHRERDDHSCSKVITSEEKLWIAISSWNNAKQLEKTIQSVLDQDDIGGYKNVMLVIFEDYSEDDMLSDEIREAYESLRTDRFAIFFVQESDQNRPEGAAFAKWSMFQYIRDHALPHEYVILLHDDGVLADERIVEYLHRELRRQKAWIVWGRYNSNDREFAQECSSLQDRRSESSPVLYNEAWMFCHPLVMIQSHLLLELETSDFQSDDNEWLQTCTDCLYIDKFMRLAGPERVSVSGENSMFHYSTVVNGQHDVFSVKTDTDIITRRDNTDVTSKPNEIYVVACVYNRQNTETFFRKLLASKLPVNATLNVHICNNDKRRQTELESLAVDLRRPTGRTSITIHEMAYNMGGYSRFVLSRNLMASKYIDYIIMLDDDQYVRPTTIGAVYEARAPMTYKAWFGKNWDQGETSYWEPQDKEELSTNPKIRGNRATHVRSWQYGGTGMSIIDAAIFQTQQLFELKYRFRFMEDIWLSYIVHQLPEWSIGRLFVLFDSPGNEYAATTGQFMALRKRKTEMFAHLNFLRCHLPETESSALAANN